MEIISFIWSIIKFLIGAIAVGYLFYLYRKYSKIFIVWIQQKIEKWRNKSKKVAEEDRIDKNKEIYEQLQQHLNEKKVNNAKNY